MCSCEDPVLQGQIQIKYDSKASKSSANTVVDFTSAKGTNPDLILKKFINFFYKNVCNNIFLNRCFCIINGVETFDMVIQRAERIS